MQMDDIKTEAVGIDGIGLNLLKYCSDILTPYVAHIVNSSIKTSTFPDLWKVAIVRPMPKVAAPKNFRDLRPISILPPSKQKVVSLTSFFGHPRRHCDLQCDI